MRIFVTGATGVIGRRVVPTLIGRAHQVTAAVRSAEGAAAVERAGARAVRLDLFDAAAVARAVAGHDTVVNLATHMPPSAFAMLLPGAWRENDRIRRDASRILVDAALAAGASRFVQESFALTYPDCGDEWIDEGTPLAPARYNRTVLDAERSAQRFTSGGGAGVVLRFAGFYGPDSRVLHEMIGVVRKGWSPLPGSPRAFLSSVSHDDAAAALVAALDAPAGTYNVGDDRPVRRDELVGSLAAALGARRPRFAPPWTVRLMGPVGETMARSLRLSNRKLRGATGWAPRHPSVTDAWPEVVSALGRESAPTAAGSAGAVGAFGD